MKTKILYILILAVIYSLQINFAQKPIKSIEKNQSDFPCPVEAPYYLNPPDGTINAPVRDLILDWVNGAGTIYVEVWFGIAANVLKVYDGLAISSYSLPLLDYDTTYEWFIVCKDDTCGKQSSFYSFSTEELSNFPLFQCEEFNDLNDWTIIGPLGTTNWSSYTSSNAGGSPPELRFSWTPSFTGESKIRSTQLLLSNNYFTMVAFNFFFDWYANPSGTITVGITYDGGITTNVLYSLVDPIVEVGPTLFRTSFFTPSSGSSNAQFEISFNGNSFNNDNIYWDNLCYDQCLSCLPPNAPTNLTSQVIVNPNAQVQLNWQDNSWDENGFRIIRKIEYPGAQTNYILVGVTPDNFTQFVDSTVLPESTYTYKVISFNLYGEGTSNTSTITVSVPVGIEEITNEVLPQEFALHQNYPNPFNPNTVISYQLPVTGNVTLKVFDILGNEVATLVNEEQAPGVYEVEFNVAQVSRPEITSGVYFYQLLVSALQSKDGKAGNFIETKKMLLLK